MKPSFSTIPVTVAEERYHVIVKKIPGTKQPNVGFDSPDYLRPGTRPQVQVKRILDSHFIDVTDDLLYWRRRRVEEAARLQAGGKE